MDHILTILKAERLLSCANSVTRFPRHLCPPILMIIKNTQPTRPYDMLVSANTAYTRADHACHYLSHLAVCTRKVLTKPQFGDGRVLSLSLSDGRVLTFESVDEILKCDHSNESY